MPRKKRATEDQIKQVVELSSTKTRAEISEITGLSHFAIQYIQQQRKIHQPKMKNRLINMEPEGEFFDIDKYARKYIC